ncbi:MAG: hypothetical protein CVV64_09445 [Candidatus Wallbacteria bacterium HGW-Wallbacteria-1]|jgi:hypothetical protein|uniref:EF-hand domain-containing protein n=1 Tax=Candidatus Wallbacteria bacterium HGW-Wallbacteria-1 TaxID=2013854 RepID=A0A2N1PQM0_9BACT|nr:MAG: hypothetical protein CVV64_09445 [Candidatus Wallbacteria bacterium HGW-Wallbacteria-1]
MFHQAISERVNRVSDSYKSVRGGIDMPRYGFETILIVTMFFLMICLPAIVPSAAYGAIPQILSGLDELEGNFVPVPVRDRFYTDFANVQKLMDNGKNSEALKLLESLVEVPCHSITRAKIRILTALALRESGLTMEACDNYILGVLANPLLLKMTSDFEGLIRIATVNLSKKGQGGVDAALDKLRLHCYRAFQAYVRKKPDFSQKELARVDRKLFQEINSDDVFAMYHRLSATVDTVIKGTGTSKSISPLLASLEAKGDDYLKTGIFDKALAQYETVMRASPGSADIAQKVELAKTIIQQSSDNHRPEGFEYAKLSYLDLHTLSFPLMLEAYEKYRKAQSFLDKGKFRQALELFAVLATYPLPASPKSKLMFSVALCNFRLKNIYAAGMAYADSVLLDRGILGADDRGMLVKAMDENGRNSGSASADGNQDDPCVSLYLSAVSNLIKGDFNSLDRKSAELKTAAVKSGNRKMEVRSLWLSTIASSEKQLDNRLAAASRPATAGQTGRRPLQGRGKAIAAANGPRVAPKAGVAMREGKVIKEIYPFNEPDPDGEHGDMNGNGKLDWDDIRMIEEIMGGRYKSLPAVLSAADINGDGVVTETDKEFGIWLVTGKPGDVDGDGVISPGEVEGFYKIYNKIQSLGNLEDLYEHERMELQKDIDKYDFNKDGVLTYPDYRLLVASYSRIFGPRIKK